MKRSLLFGLFCLPVGLSAIVFNVINYNNYDSSWWKFQFSIAAASILVPAFLWYLIIERKKRFSIKRGIAVGVLGAVLSHYFSWFFFLNSFSSLLDEKVVNLLFTMKAAFTGSIVSLLLFGLLHLPLGGLIGGRYANYVKEKKQKILLKKAADILKVV